MAKNDSRRGATNLGTPLMIVAFVVIGGFMYWLSEQAAAERAQRAIDEVPVEDTTPTMSTVPIGDLEADGTPFEGQEVQIGATNVASLLGEQGFWLETPSGNPFLVSKGPAVVASGVAITPGSAVTVTGTVHAMSDSVLTAWTESGGIAEGDRIVAEFATHFIEATEVEPAQGGGQGAADPSGSDEGNGASGN